MSVDTKRGRTGNGRSSPARNAVRGISIILIICGLSALQGCDVLSEDVRGYVPDVIGIKRVIYGHSFFETFVIYELSDQSAAEIQQKGLAILQGHTMPRSSNTPSTIAKGYISWRETPMFDRPGYVREAAIQEAHKYYPRRGQSYTDSFERSFRFKENDLRRGSYLKLIEAARKPGSYFTVGKMQDCGLIIDPKDKLAMLFCGEQ